MTKLFDFDDNFRDTAKQILNINSALNEFHKSQEDNLDEVEKLNSDLIVLANKMGVFLESI